MGTLLALVLLSVLGLAVLGLGVGPFITGVITGGKAITSNPTVLGFTNQVEQYLWNFIQSAGSKSV